MLDQKGRLAIGKDILERQKEIHVSQEVLLFLDHYNNEIVIKPKGGTINNELHFIKNARVDPKGRIFVPKVIRGIFPNAKFLPAEKNGKIYILIIDNAKKSE